MLTMRRIPRGPRYSKKVLDRSGSASLLPVSVTLMILGGGQWRDLGAGI